MAMHKSIKKIIKKLKSNDAFKDAWRESYKPNLTEFQKKQPNKIDYVCCFINRFRLTFEEQERKVQFESKITK